MSEVKKKAIWKRWWFIAVISMFLFVFISAFLLLKDVEAKEAPGHLRYEYPSIADEDNIYVDLVTAIKDLEKLKTRSSGLKLESDELDPILRDEYVQKLEQDMPESIKNFRKQISKKSFYLSKEIFSANDSLEELGAMRFFYTLEGLIMIKNAHASDWDAVDENIRILNAFYNKLETVNCLIEGTVFKATRRMYLLSLNKLLDEVELPTATLELILHELNQSRSWEELARVSFIAELNFMKAAALDMNKGTFFRRESEDIFQKTIRANVFYQGCFEYFDFLIQNLRVPEVDISRPSPLEVLEAQENDTLFLLLNREKLLHLMIFPAMKVAERTFRQLSGFEDLLRLRVASLLYHREYGRLPKTINDLVPKYLSKVPRDVYSGEEIIYDGENARFYFCGPDLKDDKGQFTKKLMQQLNYEGDIVQYIFAQEQEVEEIKEKTSPISKFSRARLNRK